MIKARRTKGATRVGALLVLASCFVISALIRAGEVVAALPEGLDDGFGNPIAVAPAADPELGEKEPLAKEPLVLVAELERQREQIATREAELAAREQKLETIERRLKKRLEELRSAKEKLEKTASLVDNAAGKDVERLAQMYQQMKPKQASQIFDQMAPSFAAGFLSQMRPDAAALVLANMQADKAYAVSLMLAGRNMNRPGLQDQQQDQAEAGQ